MPNPLKCCNCGKKIAEEVAIQVGTVKITCKCGTVNEVRADVKEVKAKPYGDRLNYEFKDHNGQKVEATIAIYGQPNAQGDVFMPGCFDKAMKQK